MTEEKKAVGRPTKYDVRFCDQVYRLSLLGSTDEEMAHCLGVTEKTFIEWKQGHEEFLQSITRGKEDADGNVAERLYQRALGYSHAEEKIFQSDGKIIRAETTKHYPPDTQAASLWLRNRQPQKWRDKVDHEHSGPGGGKIQIEASESESLRRIAFLHEKFRRETGSSDSNGGDEEPSLGAKSGTTD